MTQTAMNTIRLIPDTLRRRNIRATRGYSFNSEWAESLIAYFHRETAAKSVAYAASLDLDGTWYNGIVEVDRDGHLMIRRKHAE